MVINLKFCVKASQLLCVYVVLYFSSAVLGQWDIGFFDEPKFDGYWKRCDENYFDENNECSLNEDINYRSVKLRSATCVEMNLADVTYTITQDIEDFGRSFKGGHARKCETHNVSLICPNGTFAKGLEWDTKFDMTKGIKLSCYSPEHYNSNGAVLESHPGSRFDESGRRKCPAISGITFITDDTKDSIVALDLKKNCTVGYKKGVASSCIPETALTGLNVEIETETNYIKTATSICTEIPDIATLCNADDETQILLTYAGTASTTFTIQKKFGVGQTSVTSDLNRNEYDFYKRSGFEIQTSTSTLKENLKENLGLSIKTGFDWHTSPDEMWQAEQSTPIKIQTKSGCSTEVLEIVGRCSFMDARPAEYVIVDICDGIRNETTVPIADNIVNSTYSKDILTPDHTKKLHEYKVGEVKNNAIAVVATPMPFAYTIEKFLRTFNWFNKSV